MLLIVLIVLCSTVSSFYAPSSFARSNFPQLYKRKEHYLTKVVVSHPRKWRCFALPFPGRSKSPEELDQDKEDEDLKRKADLRLARMIRKHGPDYKDETPALAYKRLMSKLGKSGTAVLHNPASPPPEVPVGTGGSDASESDTAGKGGLKGKAKAKVKAKAGQTTLSGSSEADSRSSSSSSSTSTNNNNMEDVSIDFSDSGDEDITSNAAEHPASLGEGEQALLDAAGEVVGRSRADHLPYAFTAPGPLIGQGLLEGPDNVLRDPRTKRAEDSNGDDKKKNKNTEKAPPGAREELRSPENSQDSRHSKGENNNEEGEDNSHDHDSDHDQDKDQAREEAAATGQQYTGGENWNPWEPRQVDEDRDWEEYDAEGLPVTDPVAKRNLRRRRDPSYRLPGHINEGGTGLTDIPDVDPSQLQDLDVFQNNHLYAGGRPRGMQSATSDATSGDRTHDPAESKSKSESESENENEVLWDPFLAADESDPTEPQKVRVRITSVFTRSSWDDAAPRYVQQIYDYLRNATDNDPRIAYQALCPRHTMFSEKHNRTVIMADPNLEGVLQMWLESYNTYHLIDGLAMKEAWGGINPDIVLSPRNLQAILDQVRWALAEDANEGALLSPRFRAIRLEGGAHTLRMGYNAQSLDDEYSVVNTRV